MIKYKIRAAEPFKDGTIFPERIRLGQELVVDERTLERIRNSGGRFDILEKVIPNPLKVPEPAPAPAQEETLDDLQRQVEELEAMTADLEAKAKVNHKRKKVKKDEA